MRPLADECHLRAAELGLHTGADQPVLTGRATSMLPLLPVMMRACRRHLPRALRMQKLMETKHKQQSESHYYLAYIGTDPASQGKGYGTALLHHTLRRCDAEHMPAY
jgi:ribosomal protein S18 acetylase RimI-like enzyme